MCVSNPEIARTAPEPQVKLEESTTQNKAFSRTVWPSVPELGYCIGMTCAEAVTVCVPTSEGGVTSRSCTVTHRNSWYSPIGRR